MHKPKPDIGLIQSPEVLAYYKLTGDTVDITEGKWVSDTIQDLATLIKANKSNKHYVEVLWLTHTSTLIQAVDTFGQTVVAELTDIQQSVISARYRTAKAFQEVVVPLIH